MKFSSAYRLGMSQAELDFVDVDLDSDTPLFLDPYALTTRDDAWSAQCHGLLLSYFEEILIAIKQGLRARGVHLLSHLNEPDEIRLGVSKGHSKGRGIGAIQAADLFKAMAESTAAKTGLLEDLGDFALFVPGIGQDKISDMTANVIRKPLIDYTNAQTNLLGIPTRKVASGFYWDGNDWTQSYVDLPTHNGSRIILVPKFAVRYRVGVDSQKYRNDFVLDYLQAEHLRADDGLVTTLRDRKGNVRKKIVYKKTVSDYYPATKDFLADFSRNHPQIIESYRNRLRLAGRDIPNLGTNQLVERDLAKHLAERLREIPSGAADADNYHSLMIGVISFLFFPNLIYPNKESKINEGRKRIDITYTNGKVDGLFNRLAFDQFLTPNIIHVECKNYSNEIANPEFDQMIGRFNPARSRFGMLLFRKSENLEKVFSRARDAMKARQGLILPLDDDFVTACLDHVENGNRFKIDAQLNDVYQRVVS
jgi:hypothetical protein